MGNGPFDGQAEGSVPDGGGEHSPASAHTEHHSVVVLLVQSIVGQKSAAAGVNIRPRVAHLSSGEQFFRNNTIAGFNQVD